VLQQTGVYIFFISQDGDHFAKKMEKDEILKPPS